MYIEWQIGFGVGVARAVAPRMHMLELYFSVAPELFFYGSRHIPFLCAQTSCSNCFKKNSDSCKTLIERACERQQFAITLPRDFDMENSNQTLIL